MRRLAILAIFLLPAACFAEDSLNQKIEKNYVDPVLSRIESAARTGADPNATQEPSSFMPSMDPVSPSAKKAADFATSKLIDPIGDQLSDTASHAAHALGSADANADASGLEDRIFDFPNQMALKFTGMIQGLFQSPQTLSAPAQPLPDQSGRDALAPLAVPKDFYYRKDSLSLVKGSAGAGGLASPKLSQSGNGTSPRKFKPFRIDKPGSLGQ
jgi:hypothetical protein